MLDPSYLSITAVVTTAYQLLFFVAAATLKIDTVTDFAGGTNFVVLALLTLFISHTFHVRQVLATVCVVVWGLRLSLFLLFRILLWGSDKRFDGKRENCLQFFGFWVLQGVWVWTVSMPVTLLNNELSKDRNINALDVLGWLLFMIGLVIESIADFQKLYVKQVQRKAKNDGLTSDDDTWLERPWCHYGLWSWSRHPNYFGEMMLWWGVFLSCTSAFVAWEWIALVGPLFISALLLFGSGMPILESNANKRYGHRTDYIEYRERTSPLIPMPPVVYRSIPRVAKLLLFEWPMYAKELSGETETLR